MPPIIYIDMEVLNVDIVLINTKTKIIYKTPKYTSITGKLNITDEIKESNRLVCMLVVTPTCMPLTIASKNVSIRPIPMDIFISFIKLQI